MEKASVAKAATDSSYRMLQLAVSASLLVYAGLGLRVHYLLRTNQIPFCSAAIFETAPNRKQLYTMRIHQQGENVLNPPKYFIDVQEMFESSTATPAYLSLFEVFGKELERAGKAAAARWRSELERKITKGPLTYEMVLIEYNPVDYVRDRSVLSLKSLGRFTTSERRQ